MQSRTEQGRTPLPLPWGFGSMAYRGTKWWLTWRDAKGETHFDNSGTDDAREAQRILAGKVLPRARAMVALLERIAHGRPYQNDARAGTAVGKAKARRVPENAGRDRAKAGKGTR